MNYFETLSDIRRLQNIGRIGDIYHFDLHKLLKTSQQIYKEAEVQQDKENKKEAYIYFFKYIHLIQKINEKQEFTEDQEYFESMFNIRIRVKKAIEALQDLTRKFIIDSQKRWEFLKVRKKTEHEPAMLEIIMEEQEKTSDELDRLEDEMYRLHKLHRLDMEKELLEELKTLPSDSCEEESNTENDESTDDEYYEDSQYRYIDNENNDRHHGKGEQVYFEDYDNRDSDNDEDCHRQYKKTGHNIDDNCEDEVSQRNQRCGGNSNLYDDMYYSHYEDFSDEDNNYDDKNDQGLEGDLAKEMINMKTEHFQNDDGQREMEFSENLKAPSVMNDAKRDVIDTSAFILDRSMPDLETGRLNMDTGTDKELPNIQLDMNIETINVESENVKDDDYNKKDSKTEKNARRQLVRTKTLTRITENNGAEEIIDHIVDTEKVNEDFPSNYDHEKQASIYKDSNHMGVQPVIYGAHVLPAAPTAMIQAHTDLPVWDPGGNI